MHRSGPLSLTFEGPGQGFGGKNCQNARQGKPCYYGYLQIQCQFSVAIPVGWFTGSDIRTESFLSPP